MIHCLFTWSNMSFGIGRAGKRQILDLKIKGHTKKKGFIYLAIKKSRAHVQNGQYESFSLKKKQHFRGWGLKKEGLYLALSLLVLISNQICSSSSNS